MNKETEIINLIKQDKDKEVNYNEVWFRSNKSEQEDFDKKYQELKIKHDVEYKQINGQAALNVKIFESAISKMKYYEEAKARYEKSFDGLIKQINDYKEQIDKVTGEYSEYSKKLNTLEELKRAIKSYLSCSFDDILEEISDNATKLVRNVPNMANATIQLTGTRETKEGKLKEEVNAMLHLDGDENIDIRSLSGGERSSVDLAIDLSVIGLIESRTNKGINLLILDEPFTGLDSTCCEMALEILKNLDYNKKIIIVDHNPIVKEAIADKIIVIRDGEISHVRSPTN